MVALMAIDTNAASNTSAVGVAHTGEGWPEVGEQQQRHGGDGSQHVAGGDRRGRQRRRADRSVDCERGNRNRRPQPTTEREQCDDRDPGWRPKWRHTAADQRK